MGVSLVAPPLVGIYGQPGVGKSADKIWACPDALFFASPGALSPAVSIVGFAPPNVILLDPSNADMTVLKKQAEEYVKRHRKEVTGVVIDDFSMVAHRTARMLLPSYKDGRQLYGRIRMMSDEMFDQWRGWGLPVLVDTHEDPLEYETDKEGKPTDKIKHIGMPDLPGQKSAPDMVKAFDMFYRARPDVSRPDWPFCYQAGPWGLEGSTWYTKDRWSVAPGGTGRLPLNLGEIMRAVRDTNGKRLYSVPRPKGIQEIVEPYVVFAFDNVMSGQSESAVINVMARAMVEKSIPVHLIRWAARDARARIEIERSRAPGTVLASMGITI